MTLDLDSCREQPMSRTMTFFRFQGFETARLVPAWTADPCLCDGRLLVRNEFLSVSHDSSGDVPGRSNSRNLMRSRYLDRYLPEASKCLLLASLSSGGS